MRDKIVGSPEEALADLTDGASIAVTGFGTSYGFPVSLLVATKEKGVKNLTMVTNGLGAVGSLRSMLLVASEQVSHLIAAFSWRPGPRTPADDQIDAGTLSVELVPQGVLVERMRAGGAGIPAFYSPVGVGTSIHEGKELRELNGKTYVLEKAINVDFALVRAYRADRLGNLDLRGSNRNFTPAFAKAAKCVIAEVDEIVEVGEIDPENVGLPGIFVNRVVKATVQPDSVRPALRRPKDAPREYNGKHGWTRLQMAERIAGLLEDGTYVNLGVGMPTLVSNFIEGRDIILHGENGILGYGEQVDGDRVDKNIFNAAGEYVSILPGAAYFDSVEAFEMARGGHLHTVVLGAYEVDQEGSIANYSVSEWKKGGIGGAMDLIAGKRTLIVMMEHRDSKDRPKLRKQCTYPLTGKQCVDIVVTDLAILRRTGDTTWKIEAVADGFTPEEVVALTELEVAGVPTPA
jgi:3-oxoacid CoA-transferase